MSYLSTRILEMNESQTLAMARKSRELQAQGIDIISLSLGEPDFDTPNYVKDAAKKAIDENYTHYPPVNGYLPVRQAIANKLKRDNSLTYTAEQIVVSTGAKQSLVNLMNALINPGDEVLLPAPYWVSYYEMVRMVGGVPVVIESDVANDFKISADEIEKHITPKTKVLLYSSPCNPSGSVFTPAELQRIAQMLQRYPNILVISDEIYELITFEGKHTSIATFDGMQERTIIVNGVAKGFAMTGWRIGYIAAPLDIAQACTKMQGQVTSGANTIAQMATKAAVEADPSAVAYMRETFLKRRAFCYELLSEIKGMKVNMPAGAFYFFPDISAFLGKTYNGQTIKDSDDLAMYLLSVAHVATVGGGAFGSPNCLRLSYAAADDQLKEAIRRMKKALEALL